jgi:hypothetical protein
MHRVAQKLHIRSQIDMLAWHTFFSGSVRPLTVIKQYSDLEHRVYERHEPYPPW